MIYYLSSKWKTFSNNSNASFMLCFNTTLVLGYRIFSGDKLYFANEVNGVINTINPHSYIIARNDYVFKEALVSSDYLIPDGVGIKLASRILCREKIEKIAGYDLHEILIKSLNNRYGSCFYLGSSESTLEKIIARLSIEYPNLKTNSYSPPFKKNFSEQDNGRIIDTINGFLPDVLFVGLTAPKQEKWVYENRERLNVPLICCIGAAFDFYAGTVKRPGRIWIRMGLEWLPRLLREPRRLWKRNLVSTPLFLWYLLIEKFRRMTGKCGDNGESQR